MAVNITATRTSTLFNDQDGDSVFDPGDVVLTKIRITNLGTTDATGVSVTDTLNGVTLVPGSVQVTPIAFDDFMPSIVGNTPITFTAAQLLGNDIDPDGAEINLTISGVSNAVNGAIVNNGNGTFTFTPTTGFAGTGLGGASFQYTITDEQGLGSVTTGIVRFDVTDPVWYVNNATGSDVTGDGSYAKPFASLTPLSTGGSADALDNADDTIFVYNAGTYANASITLETNQKLFGDGHAFVVNGLTIGANASNTTLSHAGAAVTLASGNTIDGFDLVGTATGAVGIQDGGVAAGTVTITGTSITGQGQILDIDQGGTLAVTLTNIASTGSTGANGGVIDLTGVGGTLTVSGTTTVNGTHGQAGIDISGNSGLTVDFQGNVVVNTGANIAVNITGNTGTNSITFSGASKDIDTTGAIAVNLTGNTTSTTVGFTNGGLDIDSTTGAGLNMDATTLNVTGGTNTINTTTGQIMSLVNGQMGTSGIAFTTLGSGTVAAGNAININNLDAAGAGTFSGGAVTVGGASGASADGINITSSNSTFTFASATIDNTVGDGIEINGQTQTQGAVTFTTVDLDGMTGAGVNIAGASNAVTISGGTIGSTNDSQDDGVRVNGGTGAVTVAATVSQSSAGNSVVDISAHSGGAISFTGAVTAATAGGGIRLVNNTGGNIGFTGDVSVNLTTAGLNALTFTNTAGTGANVTFSGGTTDLSVTSGMGINATNSTVGAGSLTISGASNTVAATTGRAINVDGVTLNATFLSVGVSGGGTTTGVWLQNTGASGQFVVTGTGSTAGSGGTIANIGGADAGSITAQPTTGTGIYMNNVANVSLSNMIFGANAGTMNNFGIRGDNVNNFTLRDSEFRGIFGTNFNFDEAAIRFGSQNVTTGLTGTALFEGNNIAGGIEDNLAVYVYGSNTLNITVRDNATSGDQAIFGLNDTTNGNDGFYLESGGTSNVTVNVTGVAFNGARGDLMQVLSTGSTTQNITIQNNQFINAHTNIISGGGGLAITGGGTNINIDYLVDGNTFKGMRASAIFSSYGGVSGTISGLITNNVMGTANGVYDTAQANRGSMEGMFFFGGVDAKQLGSTGNVNYALRIEGNTIRDVNGIAGIFIRSNQQDSGGQSRVEATIANNTMAEMGPNIAGGIYLQPGGASLNNDKGTIGANISNNNINFTIGGASASGDAVVFDQASTIATFYMPGYTSAPSADPNTLANFLKNTKGNVFTNAQVSGTGGVLANTSAVQNQAFILTVPSAMAPGFGIGWEDLAVSPVTPPPSDPEPATPDASGGGGDTSSGGGDGGGTGDTGGGGDTGGSGDPAPVVVNDNLLTLAELNFLVEEAIDRWIDAGATPAQIDAMRAVQFGIVDMAGIYVGSSNHGVINIDSDGAGYGWFVDATPGDDSEFEGSGTRLTADAGGAAAGKLDLLTVLMHELGHQIGLDDDYVTSQADDVMFGYMNVGERRLPADGEAAGAVPGSVGAEAFALTPVSIGTLPSNKAVDVFFKATINAQLDGFIVNLNNDSTISGSNFSNVIANEQNILDSLTLGNVVYLDANKSGFFDPGEGVVGVSVSLYVDTNDSGGWDAGDALLATQSTLAGGLYSFVGLAPGDYIVVVNASNFNSGQPLNGLLIAPGVAADPDNNVDNDNNGVAATGGAVASQTITLAYNTEPTAGTGNDTNNTLDFGFVSNSPPVANDDSVTVAEDSGANDLTTQLLTNDTDPDSDTKTITSATQGAHGTTSVVAGVLTYTPAGNYNGTDTFTYTIDDGHGHTDTATVNVTVSAANDPVTGSAPATASVNEDATNVAVTGLSISDVDATLAPSGVYDVTLSATHGTLTLTTLTGLTFGTGDGTDDATMTFHGTLAAINTALATAKYTPVSNYNGPAQIDLQVTDTFGGIVATGTGVATNDTDSIAVTVNSVNDEPAGTDDSAAVVEGITYTFLTTDFSDGFSDPIDGNAFAGVKITELPDSGDGVIKLNGVDISANDVISKTQLDNGELTFVPAVGSGGSTGSFKFAVKDDGGITNGGVEFDQSPNTFTLNIAVSDIAPVLDLDADGAGTGFASSYTEGGAAAAIGDTDVSITDADSGDDIVSATITITNAETGDKLNVGTLPATVTVDVPNSTDTVVKLVAAPGTSAADFEAAIEAITYSSTSDDPTDHGTNMARSITVVVNDGTLNSNVATATVNVTDVNDDPSGTSSTITASEDSFRLLSAGDLGFNDVDGTFASVTISGVTGGGIYFDADGTAGAGTPVLESLPKTYTAQDLIDGKVSFKASQDLNGTGVGTITFAVTDDDGATDASPNVLTVDVTAVNDSPVLTTGGPIAATEQTTVAILTGASVADVDLDARNGGNGDYAGASFSVNRNPATNPTEDVFTLVAGPNFTIDGSNNLKAGGQIFGTISVDGSAGLIVINFTSLETAATSALVDEVIQAVRYTNTSNNPPASVDLAVGFDDGSPGGGQGSGATDLDINLVTVNITAVNDAPVNSLGGTIGTGEDAIDAWLSGMSISDPDANPATDDIVVTFDVDHGTLDIRTDVAGGVTGGDVTGDDTGTITVTATLNEINATLAASNGLTYSPDHNFNGNDTLTVTTNDQGHNGTDPNLTGDGSSEEDVDTRTISVSAADDPAEAKNDAVSTLENAIGMGNLFVNNGSGPDADPEGDPFVVTAVNGAAVVGSEITLASGAKLTVNSNGSYSYNPDGKFTKLTDNTSGAVNTSAVETFQYTITGGSIATVTLTVNGVAGPGDWLMGDGTGNTITGTPGPDLFVVSQGGNDNVSGLGGKDNFYFGGALTAADNVNGGADTDTIVLQGNYSGGLILDGSVTEIEGISFLAGTNTTFGDPGTNLYDYDITTDDENFAAGVQARVNGSALLAGEDLTFDGSDETDASFVIYGGKGSDDLTGGDGNDIFFFAEAGRFAAGDTVDGGDGYDGLFLRGNYTIDFTQAGFAGAFQNMENMTLSSATDERYARGGGTEFDYSITWDDDLLASGQTMTINGALLKANETMVFDGSDESNGNFKIFGGAASDVLTGGDGIDVIFGGLSNDTLYGGAGNDQFRYDTTAESTSVARDGIQDFALGDVLDLSRIDANTLLDGNQAFNFIGNAAFGNNAGELRFANIAGPIWLVQGDTNGDGVSDFEVVLVINDLHPITAGDFIL